MDALTNAVKLKRRHVQSATPHEIVDGTDPPQSSIDPNPLPVLLRVPKITLRETNPTASGLGLGPTAQTVSTPPSTGQSKPALSPTQPSRGKPPYSRKRDYRIPVREWRQLVWQGVVGLALVGFFVLAYLLVTGGHGLGGSPQQSASTDDNESLENPDDSVSIDVTGGLPLRDESTTVPYRQPPPDARYPTAQDNDVTTMVQQDATRIARRAEPLVNESPAKPVDADSSSLEKLPSSNNDRSPRGHTQRPPQYDYPHTAPKTYRYRPGNPESGRYQHSSEEATRGSHQGSNPGGGVRLQGIEPPPFERDRSRP